MLEDGGGGAPYDVDGIGDGCCGDATTVGSIGVD